MAALGEDLLSTVNKLQDLVFNTIGSDSLDLPQIVRCSAAAVQGCALDAPEITQGLFSNTHRFAGRRRFPVGW